MPLCKPWKAARFPRIPLGFYKKCLRMLTSVCHFPSWKSRDLGSCDWLTDWLTDHHLLLLVRVGSQCCFVSNVKIMPCLFTALRTWVTVTYLIVRNWPFFVRELPQWLFVPCENKLDSQFEEGGWTSVSHNDCISFNWSMISHRSKCTWFKTNAGHTSVLQY